MFWKQLRDTLVEFATSKKAIAAVVGVIVTTAGTYGLELPTDALALVVSPIIAYIVGQGWADSGKPAAAIQAESVKGMR